MTIESEMQAHARAVRARLYRPQNAVEDKGLDLGGKAAERARVEMIWRSINESMQFAAEMMKGDARRNK